MSINLGRASENGSFNTLENFLAELNQTDPKRIPTMLLKKIQCNLSTPE